MCHRRAAVAMCFEFNAQLRGRENLIVGIEETICVKFALKMAGKKYTVKRKYEDEHRTFLTEWQSLYCFVERSVNFVRRDKTKYVRQRPFFS